jgi:hypothetical protein
LLDQSSPLIEAATIARSAGRLPGPAHTDAMRSSLGPRRCALLNAIAVLLDDLVME